MDKNKTNILDSRRYADLDTKISKILPEFGEVKFYEIPEVKEIVSKALKAHKIKFDFNDATGNFIIPIVAGVAIIAEFGRETSGVYLCQVGFNTDNLDDPEKTVGGFVMFSPEAIERYIPTFKAIISTTEDFLRPYIKTQTESNNLKDIVTREITSLGLSDVVVAPLERYDYKSLAYVYVEDTYTLTKEIIPGLRIGIRFTPEDYKSKCARFKEVVSKVPKTFTEEDWSNIQCEFNTLADKDKYKCCGRSWVDAPEKMNYVDTISVGNSIAEKSSIPEKVIKALTEMGFIFTFKDDVLNVCLSADFTLCRKAKKVYFETSERASTKLTLNDEEFITLLRIIAKASTRNGYLSPNACGIVIYNYPLSFYDGLLPAIREFVPPMSDIGVYSRKGDCTVAMLPAIGFLLPFKNAPKALWTFLSNINAIQELVMLQSKKLKGPFVEVRAGENGWQSLKRNI